MVNLGSFMSILGLIVWKKFIGLVLIFINCTE
jgi:hypothetical protein